MTARMPRAAREADTTKFASAASLMKRMLSLLLLILPGSPDCVKVEAMKGFGR